MNDGDEQLYWVLIPLMLGGLVAVIPAWLMFQKAFFTSRWRILTVLLCPVVTFILAAPAFWIPFWLSTGKEVGRYATLTDMLLFGAAPLALIALAAYVADHVSESPTRCLIAGAACMAIAILPVAYFLYANQMHADMEIQIVTSKTLSGILFHRLA